MSKEFGRATLETALDVLKNRSDYTSGNNGKGRAGPSLGLVV